MVSKTLLSKGVKLDWVTPRSLFDKLNKEFNFKLDAATCEHNPLQTTFWYTEEDNGLKHSWVSNTFINPPYGRNNIIPWLQKALWEADFNGATSVFLLPSRTGTLWFHNFIYNRPRIEVRFLKGRLLFDVCRECYPEYKQKKNTAPFDSMVVIFHGKDTRDFNDTTTI